MELTKEYLYENYIVQDKSMRLIAKELGITESTVDYWTKKYGLQFKKTDPDKVFNLQHIDRYDPIFCYYAGLVATDGYLNYNTKRISLRVSNRGSKEVFELFRCYFGYVRPIREYTNSYVKNVNYDITIPSIRIFQELEAMGIKDKKDIRTFSLEWFNSASEDCRKMFLRGVLDGDGNFHNGTFRLSMKSAEFVENLIRVFNQYSTDIYSLKYTSNSSGKQYPNVTLHKKDTKVIFDWIYEGYEQYKFADKYEQYCKQIKI